ncbi:MAG: hypothetical protein MZV64_64915 [Ignavibacteriales bacterium]|nr:hypothetical protein [Ignavibacteriales bacterium]
MHISAYGLKIEENTKFSLETPENLPEDEIAAQMYLKTIEILENNGFKHYEISNFSMPEFESKHNLAYWNNEEYYGFGLAAYGYVDGVRYSNICDLDEYIKTYIKKADFHNVSRQEMIEEAIFLAAKAFKGDKFERFSTSIRN